VDYLQSKNYLRSYTNSFTAGSGLLYWLL